MKTILYIHGAFSSSSAFNRIKEKLPDHEAVLLNYTVDQDLKQVINDTVKLLKENGKRVSIVSHSLGGILGSVIAQKSDMVDKVVTMSTPFGGSKAADIMKWFNPHPMFEAICSGSSLLRSLYNKPANAPTLSIVTIAGQNPMMKEENDGVVSIESQISWNHPEYKYLPYSHIDILMADEPIAMIEDFLFETEVVE
jgi:pimeloyl-ACP methyl ester carboxylesterase